MISQELRKARRGWALILAIALPVLALADEGQDAVRVGRVSRRTLDKVDFGIGHFSYNGTVYPIGNVPNGIPVLDGSGKVPLAALPAFASSPVISVAGRAGVVTLTTSDVVEASNLYFSNARAIAAPLTGFTAGAGTVSATDSVLSALQKHDAKIATNTSGITANGTAITAETSRATAAEGTLTTNVASNTTNIATNTSNITTLTSGKVDKTTTVNGHALSANVSVTQSDVGLSAVTNDAQTKASVMPNTAPSSGAIPIGSGSAYVPKTIVGDVTFDANGNAVSVFGINVKRSPFSAVANGTDDRNSVKSALDATISIGGGDVFLPAGTYAIGNAAPFDLSAYSNLRVRGAANGTSTLKRISSSASMFFSNTTVTGTGNITFEDLTFDGNYPTITGNSAIITVGPGVNNVTFRRCRFINGYNSFIAAQSPITVQDCTFEGVGTAAATGIVLQDGFSGARFLNNIFRGGLYGGIVQGDTESYRGLLYIGNKFDGMCWWLPPILSGSGGSVSYSSTTLTHSGVTFNLNTGRRTELNNKGGQVARIMNTRITSAGSTALYAGRTGLQDSSANLSSVPIDELVCAGNTCGLVSAVISSTEIAVEEWFDKTTLYRVAPPTDHTGYTIYNTYIGHILSWSGDTITVYRWTDLAGTAVTPSSGAPYEIAPMPNYQGMYLTTNSENCQFIGNYVARSNSDALALNGGVGHSGSGNTFYFNHDTSLTVQANNCSFGDTRIFRAGINGIGAVGNNNAFHGGVISGTNWLLANADGADITNQNLGTTWSPTGNLIEGFQLLGNSAPGAFYGVLVDAHSGTGIVSGTVIRGNRSTGHTIAEYFVGNATINPTTPGLMNTITLDSNIGSITNQVSDTVIKAGGVSTPAVTHQVLTSFDVTTGAFGQLQLASADLSDTANLVNKTTATTYTAGAKQTFGASATTAGVRFSGVTADPSSPAAGDLWFRTDLTHMSIYDGSAAQRLMQQSDVLLAAQFPALTGDITTSAGSLATTIASHAVTNAKSVQMAANTIKGNNTGSTADQADLTVSQAKTLLSVPSTSPYFSTLGTEPGMSWLSIAVTNSAANTAIAVQVVPRRNITLAKMRWFTSTTASGNYDIGVYDSTGSKLWVLGPTAYPSASTVTDVTVSPTVPMVAGTTYNIVFASDTSTAQFRGAQGSLSGQGIALDGTFIARRITSATSFPGTGLPTTSITLGSTAETRVPLIELREQ